MHLYQRINGQQMRHVRDGPTGRQRSKVAPTLRLGRRAPTIFNHGGHGSATGQGSESRKDNGNRERSHPDRRPRPSGLTQPGAESFRPHIPTGEEPGDSDVQPRRKSPASHRAGVQLVVVTAGQFHGTLGMQPLYIRKQYEPSGLRGMWIGRRESVGGIFTSVISVSLYISSTNRCPIIN